MSIRKKGDTTLRPVSIDREFDPESGDRTAIVYEGLEGDCISIAAQFRQAGARAITSQVSGPWHRVRVTMAGTFSGGGENEIVDVWERVIDYAELDLRQNPRIIALAAAESPTQPYRLLARWYGEIKRLLRDPDASSSYFQETESAGFNQLFNLMSTGAEAYEVGRVIARRRRTISASRVARSVVSSTTKFYSTAKLIDTFGIPNDIGGVLPTTGDTEPTGFKWGWRHKGETSTITLLSGKAEEVSDWTFALWSTTAYEYIS